MKIMHMDFAAKPGESAEQATARASLDPTITAAATVKRHSNIPADNITALAAELMTQSKAIQSGDLSRAEEMLTAQAHTLDVIFNRLAIRAVDAEYMDGMETYLKLALRAQSQSRATWETVSAIKNPPVAGYIKQANIAHGHQQINNSVSRAQKTEKAPTQQSEAKHELLPDSRASGDEIRIDPAVAPLGEVHRPKNGGG